MQAYLWKIDKDHIASDGETPATGRIGPRGVDRGPLLDTLTAGGGIPFRMYDDDGELCYEGRIVVAG